MCIEFKNNHIMKEIIKSHVMWPRIRMETSLFQLTSWIRERVLPWGLPEPIILRKYEF